MVGGSRYGYSTTTKRRTACLNLLGCSCLSEYLLTTHYSLLTTHYYSTVLRLGLFPFAYYALVATNKAFSDVHCARHNALATLLTKKPYYFRCTTAASPPVQPVQPPKNQPPSWVKWGWAGTAPKPIVVVGWSWKHKWVWMRVRYLRCTAQED